MAKGLLAICLAILLLNLVSSQIKITEIELNPAGEDSNKEWVELYSETAVSLVNARITTSSGKNFSFNASFSGYYSIYTSYGFLTNNELSLKLYLEESPVYETIPLSDSYNDNRTWQMCDNWVFQISSRNKENSCIGEIVQQETNIIEVKADIDKEINNYEEFEVEISAYNLEDYEYDIKIWIEKDGKIISEKFYEDKWTSGNYFINSFFTKKGDESEEIKLRIKKEYRNYTGKAKFYLKLRKKDQTIEEYDKNIVLIGLAKNKTQEEKMVQEEIEQAETDETLDLRKQDRIVYKSKNEYIKQYVWISLAILCFMLVFVYLIKKWKK